MSYPWYSCGTQFTAPNALIAICTDENCETQVIRYRIHMIDPRFQEGTKDFSDISPVKLLQKTLKWIAKAMNSTRPVTSWDTAFAADLTNVGHWLNNKQ